MTFFFVVYFLSLVLVASQFCPPGLLVRVVAFLISSSFHDSHARVQKIFTVGALLHLSSTLIRNDITTLDLNRNGNLNWAIGDAVG